MRYFNKDKLLEVYDEHYMIIQRRFPQKLFNKIEELIGRNTEKILIMCRTEQDVKHLIYIGYKKELSDRIFIWE